MCLSVFHLYIDKNHRNKSAQSMLCHRQISKHDFNTTHDVTPKGRKAIFVLLSWGLVTWLCILPHTTVCSQQAVTAKGFDH